MPLTASCARLDSTPGLEKASTAAKLPDSIAAPDASHTGAVDTRSGRHPVSRRRPGQPKAPGEPEGTRSAEGTRVGQRRLAEGRQQDADHQASLKALAEVRSAAGIRNAIRPGTTENKVSALKLPCRGPRPVFSACGGPSRERHRTSDRRIAELGHQLCVLFIRRAPQSRVERDLAPGGDTTCPGEPPVQPSTIRPTHGRAL